MKLGFIIMLILSINIMLYVGGVRVINGGVVNSPLYNLDSNNAFMSNFINTSNNTNFIPSEEFKSKLPATFNTQSGDTGSILSFIDALGAVKDFAIFLVNIIFTPIGIFLLPGIPFQLGLLIGLPLIVAGVLGILLFIRGLSG